MIEEIRGESMTPAEIRRSTQARISFLNNAHSLTDEQAYKQVELHKLQLLSEIAAQFSSLNELLYRMYREEREEKLEKSA